MNQSLASCGYNLMYHAVNVLQKEAPLSISNDTLLDSELDADKEKASMDSTFI